MGVGAKGAGGRAGAADVVGAVDAAVVVLVFGVCIVGDTED